MRNYVNDLLLQKENQSERAGKKNCNRWPRGMQLQKIISSDGDVELRSEGKLEHTSSAILTNPAILELSNVLPGRGEVESNSLGVLLYFTFL